MIRRVTPGMYADLTFDLEQTNDALLEQPGADAE